MTAAGKFVVTSNNKFGVLKDNHFALFNKDDDCPACCCDETDILIVSCNANRITDDDYDVTVNGHAVGSVPHVGDWSTGCVSPGTGIWACTDPTITASNLTNITAAFSRWTGGGYDCNVCVTDAAWTVGTLDASWLAASNVVKLDGTSDEGCADWGLVAVWTVDKHKKKLCRRLVYGAYQGGGGVENLFTGNFPWKALP